MNKIHTMKTIPDHQSAVRSMVSQSKGLDYKPLKNLDEARRYGDAYMVMEGDWGGQIYVTVPVKFIECSYETLQDLLKQLDKIEWEVNDGEGSGIYFERTKEGTPVTGGMGGGIATNAIWVHKDLEHLKSKILDVIKSHKNIELQLR